MKACAEALNCVKVCFESDVLLLKTKYMYILLFITLHAPKIKIRIDCDVHNKLTSHKKAIILVGLPSLRNGTMHICAEASNKAAFVVVVKDGRCFKFIHIIHI